MTSTPTTTTTRSGSIAGVLTLTSMVLALCSLTAVIFTALLDERNEAAGARAVESVRISKTLPAKCEQFYNNGTDQWIECMGVGKK